MLPAPTNFSVNLGRDGKMPDIRARQIVSSPDGGFHQEYVGMSVYISGILKQVIVPRGETTAALIDVINNSSAINNTTLEHMTNNSSTTPNTTPGHVTNNHSTINNTRLEEKQPILEMSQVNPVLNTEYLSNSASQASIGCRTVGEEIACVRPLSSFSNSFDKHLTQITSHINICEAQNSIGHNQETGQPVKPIEICPEEYREDDLNKAGLKPVDFTESSAGESGCDKCTLVDIEQGKENVEDNKGFSHHLSPSTYQTAISERALLVHTHGSIDKESLASRLESSDGNSNKCREQEVHVGSNEETTEGLSLQISSVFSLQPHSNPNVKEEPFDSWESKTIKKENTQLGKEFETVTVKDELDRDVMQNEASNVDTDDSPNYVILAEWEEFSQGSCATAEKGISDGGQYKKSDDHYTDARPVQRARRKSAGRESSCKYCYAGEKTFRELDLSSKPVLQWLYMFPLLYKCRVPILKLDLKGRTSVNIRKSAMVKRMNLKGRTSVNIRKSAMVKRMNLKVKNSLKQDSLKHRKARKNYKCHKKYNGEETTLAVSLIEDNFGVLGKSLFTTAAQHFRPERPVRPTTSSAVKREKYTKGKKYLMFIVGINRYLLTVPEQVVSSGGRMKVTFPNKPGGAIVTFKPSKTLATSGSCSTGSQDVPRTVDRCSGGVKGEAVKSNTHNMANGCRSLAAIVKSENPETLIHNNAKTSVAESAPVARKRLKIKSEVVAEACSCESSPTQPKYNKSNSHEPETVNTQTHTAEERKKRINALKAQLKEQETAVEMARKKREMEKAEISDFAFV